MGEAARGPGLRVRGAHSARPVGSVLGRGCGTATGKATRRGGGLCLWWSLGGSPGAPEVASRGQEGHEQARQDQVSAEGGGGWAWLPRLTAGG